MSMFIIHGGVHSLERFLSSTMFLLSFPCIDIRSIVDVHEKRYKSHMKKNYHPFGFQLHFLVRHNEETVKSYSNRIS
jgi:hypothetical protein